jgi:hypothetical protein
MKNDTLLGQLENLELEVESMTMEGEDETLDYTLDPD